MKKNFLQDVIPPVQRRSIRDIPIPNSTKHSEQSFEQENRNQDIHVNKIHKEDEPFYDRQDLFNENKTSKRSFRKIGWLVLLILIVSFIFLNRTRAEISIVPKQADINLSQAFDIYDKNTDQGDVPVGIGYKKIVMQKTSSVSVEPSGEQNVSQKATGKIKIFNKNTTKPKTLIANTRFETEKGLIFRVNKDVQIPGYTEKNGDIIPGEIEIEVVADQTGDDYNIEKANFTIPGFKDFPDLYTKIYAQSVTEMRGGYEGMKKVISEEDKAKALSELKKQINDLIQKEIQESGEEFIIVYDVNEISYSGLNEENQKNKIVLGLDANLTAYAFEGSEFAEYIVKNNLPSSKVTKVILTNKNDMEFSIQNISENQTKLSVSGLAKIEWQIDENKIKEALADKERGESKKVLSSLEEIASAEVILRPFWKSNLPKAEKIKLTIKK